MIYVLGSTGMLGRYVHSYLQAADFDVTPVARDTLDATKSQAIIFKVLYALGVGKDDVVINCMGVIKQRGRVSDATFLLVNSVFPHILSDYCEQRGANLIHVTTDCVFSGGKGDYAEWDVHDAKDIYGKSKSAGEPTNATVIRTSIIGEELHNKNSLLEWVRSMEGGEINGYTNHIWNGVTCLQFAKICELIINKDLYWEGVKHVYSYETYNKYDLVKLIRDTYALDLTVKPVVTELSCDRSLSTMYDLLFDLPTLAEQLEETKLYNLHK